MGWENLGHEWLACLKEHAMPNILVALQISNQQFTIKKQNKVCYSKSILEFNIQHKYKPHVSV